MAERAHTRRDIPGGYVIVWAGLQNGDTGEPVKFTGAADRSAQVHGTPGSGFTVTMQGGNSIDTDVPDNYGTLHTPAGDDAVLDAIGEVLGISEITECIRPIVTGEVAVTTLSVALVVRTTS